MKKVLVQFNIPGMTVKQFDQAWDELRAAGITVPEGLIHHAAAPNGNNWVVVDVWESAEAFAKFGETLGPILKKIGVADAPPTVLPLHYELSGARAQR